MKSGIKTETISAALQKSYSIGDVTQKIFASIVSIYGTTYEEIFEFAYTTKQGGRGSFIISSEERVGTNESKYEQKEN